MKKKVVMLVGSGLFMLSITGCVGSLGQKMGLSPDSNSTASADSDVQASDGTTSKAGTIAVGAGTGAVAGGVLGKIFGVNPKITAGVGALVGAAVGDAVADNNEEQANAEKALATEEADYNAKTEELQEKIDSGKE